MNRRNPAAIIAPRTGEMNQLAAIVAIVDQLTMFKPAAAIPAPSTPPTIECVVETGSSARLAIIVVVAADNSIIKPRLGVIFVNSLILNDQ